MSAIYTKVMMPTTPWTGYSAYGRKTRAEAIAEARSCYEHSVKEAQAFLALPDDAFEVAVIRGVHREKVLEELTP